MRFKRKSNWGSTKAISTSIRETKRKKARTPLPDKEENEHS
jgi:hypothetical protein